MKQRTRVICDDLDAITESYVSRRSAVAILGLLVGSALGQEQSDEEAMRAARERRRQQNAELRRRAREEAFQQNLERSPNMRAFYERVDSSASMEERMKAMQDWQRQQTLINVKNQLGVSEEEWKVIQPRLETVYLLRQPPASVTEEDTSVAAMVTRLTKELWELVNNKAATPEEIKTKLTALRTAKEKVRQELAKARSELRQLMTIRQEAVLVLNELLD